MGRKNSPRPICAGDNVCIMMATTWMVADSERLAQLCKTMFCSADSFASSSPAAV